jgi:peptidoglycan hydrolase CwlO-like protein
VHREVALVERESALLQREANASKWEEGLRRELRADAEACMKMNRELLQRVDHLHTEIAELKDKIDSLEEELARERGSRQ